MASRSATTAAPRPPPPTPPRKLPRTAPQPPTPRRNPPRSPAREPSGPRLQLRRRTRPKSPPTPTRTGSSAPRPEGRRMAFERAPLLSGRARLLSGRTPLLFGRTPLLSGCNRQLRQVSRPWSPGFASSFSPRPARRRWGSPRHAMVPDERLTHRHESFILMGMSKRLQVLFSAAEVRDLQLLARSRGLTVAAWVRQALRAAAREEPRGDFGKKLAIVRHASRHTFPSTDLSSSLSGDVP